MSRPPARWAPTTHYDGALAAVLDWLLAHDVTVLMLTAACGQPTPPWRPADLDVWRGTLGPVWGATRAQAQIAGARGELYRPGLRGWELVGFPPDVLYPPEVLFPQSRASELWIEEYRNLP